MSLALFRARLRFVGVGYRGEMLGFCCLVLDCISHIRVVQSAVSQQAAAARLWIQHYCVSSVVSRYCTTYSNFYFSNDC